MVQVHRVRWKHVKMGGKIFKVVPMPNLRFAADAAAADSPLKAGTVRYLKGTDSDVRLGIVADSTAFAAHGSFPWDRNW